jgi:hypothetical protein
MGANRVDGDEQRRRDGECRLPGQREQDRRREEHPRRDHERHQRHPYAPRERHRDQKGEGRVNSAVVLGLAQPDLSLPDDRQAEREQQIGVAPHKPSESHARKVTHACGVHISRASDSGAAKDRSRERDEIVRAADVRTGGRS